ncbi:MAG TPA: biofilm regulation protein kinase SiaB [Candidatus Competibacteraceae bacterium]|nr:biofilm regulation protein kinase SiaB [Candidatus Competibacteraceae bacterium]
MKQLDVFSLRETFSRQQILLCFNGPFSTSIIEEIGKALKHYLQGLEASASAVMDVFSVYIEMTQNVRQYATLKGYTEQLATATVVISRDTSGHYVISAGNLVEPADGAALVARIEHLAGLDKGQLKAAYKEQLRKPREPGATGAGLGLIDMARKASAPLACSLCALNDGQAFFSLRVVI